MSLHPPSTLPYSPVRTPRATWRVNADLQDLLPLEQVLPGLKVWSHVVKADGRTSHWLKRAKNAGRPTGVPVVSVPYNGWWLAEPLLARFPCSEPHLSHPVHGAWSDARDVRDRLLDEGKERFRDLQMKGLLAPEAADVTLTPYQLRNMAWDGPRSSNLMIWPAGSGKTWGAALALRQRGGATAVICPGKARPAWQNQVPALTQPVFRYFPKSDRRVGAATLDEYHKAAELGAKLPRVRARWSKVAILVDLASIEAAYPLIKGLVDRMGENTKLCTWGWGANDLTKRLPQIENRRMDEHLGNRSGFVASADYIPDVDAVIVFESPGQAETRRERAWLNHAKDQARVFRKNLQVVTCDPTQAYPPFYIFGYEALYQTWSKVINLNPRNLVYDEIHLMSQNKRWRGELEKDGSTSWHERVTKSGTSEVLAACLNKVVTHSSVNYRCGITATPIGGRPRRLWAQFDIVEPGCMGGYWDFVPRYCYNAEEPLGWGDRLQDNGCSNLDELKSRSLFMRHEVDYEESHGELPATRVEIPRLEFSEQGPQGAYQAQINALEKMVARVSRGEASDALLHAASGGDAVALTNLPTAIRKALPDLPVQPNQTFDSVLTETKIAKAASAKLPYARHRVLEFLKKPGGRVVVMLNRIKLVEDWGMRFMKDVEKLLKGDQGIDHKVVVDIIHGGKAEWEREEAVENFHDLSDLSTARLLVCTGQSTGTSVDGLQVADYFLLASLPKDPTQWLQWKGRVDRHGGRETLMEAPICLGTYDEEIVSDLVARFGTTRKFRKALELAEVDDKLLGFTGEDGEIANMTLKALGFDV